MTSRALISFSPTVENYLKHLFAQQQLHDKRLLPMGKLAVAMGVTPGTATTMVKTLMEYGLVRYEPRGGVCLTPAGQRHALNVIRRHRLVELFLVQVLGLDWSEVHIEAEELEHAISDKVLEKIDALLGFPETDPHGDPIPKSKGGFSETTDRNLAGCSAGMTVRVARVTGQDAAFLKMVKRLGLMPGKTITVVSMDALADVLTVRHPDKSVTNLGMGAARQLLVAEV